MIEGGCLCGCIKFVVDQALEDISYCHCSICRKSSGSAFAAYGATLIRNFKWLLGEDRLSEFKVSDDLIKLFCSSCGSTLVTHHQSEPEIYHVSLGCLNNTAKLKPQYHQFFNSKANWYQADDDLPKYREWPDA